METKNKSEFCSTMNKGFAITFENGLTISVQFGGGNMCDNRSLFPEYGEELRAYMVSSRTAEIAIWDSNLTYFRFSNDEPVIGWVTPDEVAVWITIASKARTLTELETFAIENNLVMPA
jgi:hypothetical protein